MSKQLSNKEFGALGEKHAAEYLKHKGYKILEKNYKTAVGEIDIIAAKGRIIAFVEVKTRSADPFLSGMYAVDRRKQFHIIRTAAGYLEKKKTKLQPRFDVIEVEIDRASQKLLSVNHIKAAFSQTEPYARF